MGFKKIDSAFNGSLTPELRGFLRQRRQRLGITLQQLAKILRVNWSTIRKWEDGATKNCRQQHIYRLTRFLSGEYDDLLTSMNAPASTPSWQQFPPNSPSMLHCIERISNIYKLCVNYPETERHLMEGLRRILQETVKRLVGHSVPNVPFNTSTFYQETPNES